MSYSTLEDCQVAAGGAENLRTLSIQSKTETALNVAVLAKFQALADGFIDSHLRKLYATPLAAPTAEIRGHAAALTIYFMREAKQQTALHDSDAHKTRLKWLEDIRDGRILPAEPLPPRSSAVRATVIELGGDVTRETFKF